MTGRVFTEAKRAALLARLRAHGRIGWALEEAGVVAATFYKTRDREPAFEQAVQDALLAAAARLTEGEEQAALEAADGTTGRTIHDNKWLLTRLTRKADRFRHPARTPGMDGHGQTRADRAARDSLERVVTGQLELIARRVARARRRAD